MTQDEPERVKRSKVDDIRASCAVSSTKHMPYFAVSEVEYLLSLLSASEKRAEEMVAELLAYREEITALRHYDDAVCTERDEARSALGKMGEILKQGAACGWDRLHLEAAIRSALQASSHG